MACKRRLYGLTSDLSAFNSVENANDVEALRVEDDGRVGVQASLFEFLYPAAPSTGGGSTGGGSGARRP